MNADTIARRIVEDARKAAQEAVDAANARAEEARKAAAAEVEKKREAALARADEDAARQRENALRMAELDQRKALLAMKREMIDSAFAQALEALIAMPVEQARAVNMRLLRGAHARHRVCMADLRQCPPPFSFIGTTSAPRPFPTTGEPARRAPRIRRKSPCRPGAG